MDLKGLNAKIRKELAEKNEGSTVWSDQTERLEKMLTSGIQSTLSSNHTTGCLQEEPHYILLKQLS